MVLNYDLPESPYLRANCLSRLFFCWLHGLFRIGCKRSLNLKDLYHVLPEDESNYLGQSLNAEWEIECEKTKIYNERERCADCRKKKLEKPVKPSLLRAIRKVFLVRYFAVGLIAFVEECVLKIIQPICLGYLIRYFTNPENYDEYFGYLMAFAVCATAGLINIVHHPYFFAATHIGMQVRIACCALLYRKSTKLSQSALQKTAIGQLVNLISNDVNRLDISSIFIHYLWIGPVQTAIITAILWQYYGPSCTLGLGILIMFVPFQGWIGSKFSVQRRATAVRTDVRIRIMTEVISGIRVLKMFAWENYYRKIVDDARKDEISCIRKTSNLRALNLTLFFTSSKFIVFATLLLFVLLGHELTAELVFVTLALYNNVRLVMTLFFPNGVSCAAEAKVSISRLNDFLLMEERDEQKCQQKFDSIAPGGDSNENCIGVFVKDISAKWNPDQNENTIENISLVVRSGQVIALTGHVGSGKGSVLHAILKELPVTQGSVFVNGTIAYAAQEPWLFSGSVRENILFGKRFKKDWYDMVIQACALTHDFELLPYGDNTLVGEKGNMLSGGQKARVTLARAVYADADIVLLDDPLSAVDAEVGKHLFTSICTGILSKKARILVTHQLQYMKYVDHIIILEDGGILAEGSFDDLVRKGINFDQMDEAFKAAQASKLSLQSQSPLTIPTRIRSTSVSSKGSKFSTTTSSPARNGISPALLAVAKDFHNEIEVAPSSDKEKRYAQTDPFANVDTMDEISLGDNENYVPRGEAEKIQVEDDNSPVELEETQVEGTVSAKLYYRYFRAGSNCCTFIIFIILNIICQLVFSGSDYWLTIWTSAEEYKHKNITVHGDADDPLYYIYNNQDVQIYGFTIICAVLLIFSWIRNVQFFHMCLKSSTNLNKSMFQGVIRAPMSFFESNPTGRILNRFSKDMGQVDDELPVTCFDTFVIFLTMFGIIIVISFLNYLLLIPALILGVIFYFLREYYLKTARSIKRLEGIARSPVFSHLNTSLYGLTTIRAYRAEPEFIRQFDRHLDLHSSTWYLFLASTRWFGICLDWISVLYIIFVTFSFLFSKSNGAEVGLAVSSAMLLTGMFQWGVRQSAELENMMVSVERIMEYSSLKSEAPLTTDKKPPQNWPKNGKIEFRNVSLEYDDNKPVLKNVTFVIHPSEKVGIVGRTGAGKSTLISILFRMYEPTGKILIDNVDIKKIGLHDLRNKISIIPQEPQLFSGTLRKNLDPFDNFTDSEIWNALEDANLAREVRQLSGITSTVAEGGANFSVGQRQLLCLARAILFHSKILVLDEATANVDIETDALIQSTMQTKFKNCTLLIVAHRLNTVMDCDRIMVLDAGKILEFEEPYKLLLDPNSALHGLVNQTGSAAEELIRQAKAAHDKRHPQTASEEPQGT